MSAEPLLCPGCAAAAPASERFCSRCGLPLVHSQGPGLDQSVSERQERARKVKRQYSEGELVRAAGAGNQAEAEFIQGLLLEEGVPSLVRRARGFDVPDFLAAGPREVLVAQSGASVAREVLLQSAIISDAPPASGVDQPLRLLAGVLGAFAIVALIAWVGAALA